MSALMKVCLFVTLAGFAFILIAVGFGYGAAKDSLSREFAIETFKTGLGGLILAVATGLLGQAFKDREASLAALDKRRDEANLRSRARAEVLKEMLAQCGDTYREVKRIRRVMRPQFLEKKKLEPIKRDVALQQYETAIKELNHCQLIFEALKIQTEGLSADVGAMKGSLKSMEGYLRCITKEYEDLYRELAAGTKHFDNLPALREFLLHTEDGAVSRFSEAFAKKYELAWKGIFELVATLEEPDKATAGPKNVTPEAHAAAAVSSCSGSKDSTVRQ